MRALPAWALAVALVATACSNPTRPAGVEEPTGPNTLTATERSGGWRLLFDGTTTAGWRGFRQSAVPGGWQAVDGALTGGGGDLVTVDQFANFELALQWQIAVGGNSGIMFRVSEATEATHLTGPELQVLDNANHPDGARALSSAGACYGLYAPSQDVARAAGAWNDTRLVVNGTRVEHWLNVFRIVEYDIGSPDWQSRLEVSPYQSVPTYAREARGHIAVQDHGDRVAYRAIKIRVLP
jgi:Domain of Unknown Function (DUF1080)